MGQVRSVRGVRQGCTLSPLLFGLYTEELAVRLRMGGFGVKIREEKLSCLLYADDIVVVSESEQELQRMLEIVDGYRRFQGVVSDVVCGSELDYDCHEIDGDHQLGRLVSEYACERKDPGSNPAADMVDAARNTAWDLVDSDSNTVDSNAVPQQTVTRCLVTAFPDVTVHDVTPDWEFVLLACDGIWDVVTSQEAVQFVRSRLATQCPPEEVCEALINRALAPDCQMGGLGCDNMTVLLVCCTQDITWKQFTEKCARTAVDTSESEEDEEDVLDDLT
ncbi:PPM-type phosphatase domain [Trinorchestia longiramus]|nr:PPM-type phosphatase domain [Trinorchestia longiramus]